MRREPKGCSIAALAEMFESSEAREIPAEGAAVDPGEVLGNGAGAVWTYAGSGTFGG